jgi:hypothetical protein
VAKFLPTSSPLRSPSMLPFTESRMRTACTISSMRSAFGWHYYISLAVLACWRA